MASAGNRLDRWKRGLTARRLVLFAYVWLMVGFASGTVVLVGPTRWLTGLVRGEGWGQGVEDVTMWVVMALYVVASFFVALWITAKLLEHRSRAFKFGTLTAVTGAAAVALWGWMNPALYADAAGSAPTEAVTTESGSRFLFGAYPDRSRLAELKAQGITAVVSLQHPAVVPFEPKGIEQEKAAARELGIRFIHAPMLPWVSDNEEALETLREVARSEGTYYVHCGLGRDRVNVARRVIAATAGIRDPGASPEEALTWGDREAEGLGAMERGRPVELSRDVWLVPFPNRHEMFGHMFGGQVAHALVLLDPSDQEEAAWLEEARARFGEYAVPWSHVPVAPGDTAAARRAAQAADTLPRPLTVIAPRTAPEAHTATAAAFQRAWKSEG